jgi:hypothetical protein
MNKFQIAFTLLTVMQSCTKEYSTGELIEDHFTYGKKIYFVKILFEPETAQYHI